MSYVDSKHPDACPYCGSTRSDEEYDELDAYAQDLLKKMVDANCEMSKLEARIKLLDEGLSWWTNRSFSGRLIKRQEDRIKELEKSLAKMTDRAIANQLQDWSEVAGASDEEIIRLQTRIKELEIIKSLTEKNNDVDDSS